MELIGGFGAGGTDIGVSLHYANSSSDVTSGAGTPDSDATTMDLRAGANLNKLSVFGNLTLTSESTTDSGGAADIEYDAGTCDWWEVGPVEFLPCEFEADKALADLSAQMRAAAEAPMMTIDEVSYTGSGRIRPFNINRPNIRQMPRYQKPHTVSAEDVDRAIKLLKMFSEQKNK